MSDEVKLYTDMECFTREFSFIKMQYCMPYFKENYKEEHKIYKQYELLINKMFKKLYDYEQENKQLKEINENKQKEIDKLVCIIYKAIEYNKENKKFSNEVENRYAEEICKNNLEILGDKEK